MPNDLERLFRGARKINTPIRLGALAIVVIGFIIFTIDEPLTLVYGAIFVAIIFIIVIVVCLAHIKRGTPPKEDVDTAEDISHDLRVKEDIWEKLDTLLQELGFSTRKRNDSEELIHGESNYKFSLAKGDTSLFIVQLAPEKLTPAAILQLRGGIRSLKIVRGYGIGKLVIICDTPQIYDGIYYSKGKDLALLLNYSINKIRGDRDAAIAHLKEQLLE
jgi:hypothetical protein